MLGYATPEEHSTLASDFWDIIQFHLSLSAYRMSTMISGISQRKQMLGRGTYLRGNRCRRCDIAPALQERASRHGNVEHDCVINCGTSVAEAVSSRVSILLRDPCPRQRKRLVSFDVNTYLQTSEVSGCHVNNCNTSPCSIDFHSPSSHNADHDDIFINLELLSTVQNPVYCVYWSTGITVAASKF